MSYIIHLIVEQVMSPAGARLSLCVRLATLKASKRHRHRQNDNNTSPTSVKTKRQNNRAGAARHNEAF